MTDLTQGKLLDLKSLLPSISEQEVSDYRDEHPDETEDCPDDGVQGAIILERTLGKPLPDGQLPVQMEASLASDVATALGYGIEYVRPSGSTSFADPVPADSQEPATPEDEKADY